MKRFDKTFLALVICTILYVLVCSVLFISVYPAHAAEVTEDFQESSVTEEAPEPETVPPTELETDPPTEPETQAPTEPEPSYEPEIDFDYGPEYDTDSVLVASADLEDLYALIRDLSYQLSLYADSIPSGFSPSNEDKEYRSSLLDTLDSIALSLEMLSAPYDPEQMSLRALQEQTDRETLESIRDSLLLLTAPMEEPTEQDTEVPTEPETEESAPMLRGESDPEELSTEDPTELVSEEEPTEESSDADPTEDLTEDPSASDLTEDPSETVPEEYTITEQDFYRLVIGLLFCILLVPILKWVMSFIKSFFPV